jgi:hypothetical protein
MMGGISFERVFLLERGGCVRVVLSQDMAWLGEQSGLSEKPGPEARKPA